MDMGRAGHEKGSGDSSQRSGDCQVRDTRRACPQGQARDGFREEEHVKPSGTAEESDIPAVESPFQDELGVI